MQAEVIAVGSELLTPSKVDTNSLFLAQRLGERGVPLVRKCVVGDDRRRLAAEIRRAREASDLVILSGGLGPTLDDLTREAASDATGRKLVFHEPIMDDIAERFRRFDRPVAPVNRRQAYVLEGGTVLPNPNGTAPGQWIEDGLGILILLPGPPRELKPLFEDTCLPRLAERMPALRFFTTVLRVAGIGESDLEERIGPIYSGAAGIETTILSAPGDVQIHLRAQSDSEASARVLAEALGAKILDELGDAVYSRDGSPLDETVANLMVERGYKLAVAESCTGGLIAGRLTDIPGSSEFLAGGFVSYSNGAKTGWLGVDGDVLAARGAVSAEVAAAMALCARRHAAEALGEPAVGLSTTGFAGPAGGTPEDPVGTVYFGVADDNGQRVHRRSLGRGRKRVRALAVQIGLELLRRRILGLGGA